MDDGFEQLSPRERNEEEEEEEDSRETAVKEEPEEDDVKPDMRQQAEPKRSKICSVCGGVSDTFHLNYGASVCLSCRAFFRRIVQKGRDRSPAFVCKSGGGGDAGGCEMSVKSRRKCQACRFDRCIKAGMNTAAVLDNSQKEARFRKMFKKQQVTSSKATTSSAASTSTGGAEKAPKSKASSSKRKGSGENNSSSNPQSTKGKRSKRTSHSSISSPSSSCSSSSSQHKMEEMADLVMPPGYGYMLPPPEQLLGQGCSWQQQQQPHPLQKQHQRHQLDQMHNFASFVQPSFNGSLLLNQYDFTKSGVGPALEAQDILGVQVEPMNYLSVVQDQQQQQPVVPGYNVSSVSARCVPSAMEPAPSAQADADMSDACGAWHAVMATRNGDERSERGAVDAFLVSLHAACSFTGDDLATTVASSLRVSLKLRVKAVEAAFLSFALRQRTFAELPQDDQFELLSRNTPALVQYVLGRCAASDSVNEQARWLFGPAPHHSSLLSLHTPVPGPSPLGSSILQVMANVLFRKPALAQRYVELCLRLRQQCGYLLPHDLTGVVALSCLYTSDGGTALSQPQDAQAHAARARALIGYASRNMIDVAGISGTLDKMSTLFEANVVWSDDDEAQACQVNPETSMAAMPFTLEEKAFSGHVTEKFNSAVRRASFGDEHLREYIMYCYDVPFSKKTISETTKVFAEKMWHVMKEHDAFNALTQEQQSAVFKRRAFHAAALFVTKMHSFTNPMDQLRFSWGDIDFENFARCYDGVIDLGKLKRIASSETNGTNPVVPNTIMKRYDVLMAGLFDLIADEEHFRIFTLITIFTLFDDGTDPALSGAIPILTQIRNHYETLFKRRLRQHMNASAADTVLSKFRAKVDDVAEIANIMQLSITLYKE